MEALEEEKMKVQRLLGKWEEYRDRRWKPKLCDLLLSEQNREPCLKKPHIIDDNVLREIGIGDEDEAIRWQILKDIKELVGNVQVHNKVFNDPVHGTIEVHPLALTILDTATFQRLRNIKQLGCVEYVFPSGSFTRFEHSIGVYHLAKILLKSISEKEPRRITEIDFQCVTLAALCHDLGQGPLSRVFENYVIESGTDYKHDEKAASLLELILVDDHPFFIEWGMTTEDKNFIKSLITSNKVADTGRGPEKDFLYGIVNNRDNGMDVDKWDYLARDCHHLGIPNGFEYQRLLPHILPKEDEDGQWILCVRDKEEVTLFNMYMTRYDLHRKVYKHQIVQGVEMMMGTALAKVLQGEPELLTDDAKFAERMDDRLIYKEYTAFFWLNSPRLQSVTLLPRKDVAFSLCPVLLLSIEINKHQLIKQIAILSYLHLLKIRCDESNDANIKEAKQILDDVASRKFWKCVAQFKFKDRTSNQAQITDKRKKQHVRTLRGAIEKKLTGNKKILGGSKVRIELADIHCGKKRENPLKDVRFFQKDGTLVSKDDCMTKAYLIPEFWQLEVYRVFILDRELTKDPETERKVKAVIREQNHFEVLSIRP